jgi:hypothetical protein
MLQHRPFTRGGRHLRVVRPRPFIPPPLPLQFWALVTRPATGVGLILRSSPGPAALAAGVGLSGLLGAAVAALGAAPAAIILLQSFAVPMLWLGAAVLLHLACLSLGGQGRFTQCVQVWGVALLVYPVVGLVELAANRWGALAAAPAAGALLVWAGFVAYHAAEQAYDLLHREALAAALLPVLAGAVLYLGWTGLFLRMVTVWG